MLDHDHDDDDDDDDGEDKDDDDGDDDDDIYARGMKAMVVQCCIRRHGCHQCACPIGVPTLLQTGVQEVRWRLRVLGAVQKGRRVFQRDVMTKHIF